METVDKQTVAEVGAAHSRLLELRGRPLGTGGVGGDGDALVKVLDGLRVGKSHRGIAENIWGRERADAEYSTDSWMRSQVPRWVPQARALAEVGWRDLEPRHVPEE